MPPRMTPKQTPKRRKSAAKVAVARKKRRNTNQRSGFPNQRH